MSNTFQISQDIQHQKGHSEGHRSSVGHVPCLLYGCLKCPNKYKSCTKLLPLGESSCIKNVLSGKENIFTVQVALKYIISFRKVFH